jgi:16S rRNA (cytidine1402-2'-O)-methyltransferase
VNYLPKGILYVTATPIGNLEDMTPRAVRVLAEADIIAAEDTRYSKTLLAHFKINTPLVSCHKFNEAEKLDYFIRELNAGKNIALISDAGTPCVSDPGARLAARAAAEGIEIAAVSGACAAVSAVSVSGFEGAAFTFLGFLPRTDILRRKALTALVSPGATVVFYESPHRVQKTLALLQQAFPSAQICLCNDLTKKFERMYRGTPGDVLAELQENPGAGKGEYTCVAHTPPGPKQSGMENIGCGGTTTASPPCEPESGGFPAQKNPVPITDISLEAQLTDAMVTQKFSLKEAVKYVYETHARRRPRIPKSEIYAASLRLKELWRLQAGSDN